MKLTLHDLAHHLKLAKQKESEAKQTRIGFEEMIADRLQGIPEGTRSWKDDLFKVTVTRKFNRSLDLDTYMEEKTTIPPDLDPVLMVPKLDLSRLRAIQEANPSLYKICSKFIITKPAKTSVTVKEVG